MVEIDKGSKWKEFTGSPKEIEPHLAIAAWRVAFDEYIGTLINQGRDFPNSNCPPSEIMNRKTEI